MTQWFQLLLEKCRPPFHKILVVIIPFPVVKIVQAKMIALDTNISNKAVKNLPFSAPNQFCEQWIHKKDK